MSGSTLKDYIKNWNIRDKLEGSTNRRKNERKIA